jgi:hypothetical protein
MPDRARWGGNLSGYRPSAFVVLSRTNLPGHHNGIARSVRLTAGVGATGPARAICAKLAP